MSYHIYKDYLEMKNTSLGSNKHFVVAYLSLHNGELFQYPQYCATEVAAANLVLDTSFPSMEQVYDYCANSDSYISVLEINNTLTE